MSDELKPCPFCGKDVKLTKPFSAFVIECQSCKLTKLSYRECDDIIKGSLIAIETWNKRVS